MANGIAQREVWLEIGAVDDIANLMQVASRENPVLKRKTRTHHARVKNSVKKGEKKERVRVNF